MIVYSCSGNVYTDGLSNGSSTRYFPTKDKALSSAIIYSSEDNEILIESNIINNVSAVTVANMLNQENWCSKTIKIGTMINGILKKG